MAIVRRGVMLSLREASCCSVEVENGGEGLRFLSVRFTLLTANGRSRSSCWIRSISACDCGSYFLPPCP